MNQSKRRFGDRSDGKLLRNVDPFFIVIPYIMRSRTDSQIFFEEIIDIDGLEKYVREKRRSEIPNLTLLHVLIAAAVRMLTERPMLNRFVAGKHVYARNHIRISMAIKRNMTVEGEETIIMPEFEPTDTLAEITGKLNSLILENKKDEDNSTDAFAKILTKIPSFILSLIVGTVKTLDKIGLCPKAINKLSPFHSSIFVTDIGSLGIESVYHHLYEFGTTSIFLAVGRKKTENVVNSDGTVTRKKTLNIKFVLDERICDGFYYAAAIRNYVKLLKTPELLETPPEKILPDPGI